MKNGTPMDLKITNRLIASSEPPRRLFRGTTVALVGLSMMMGALWANPELLGSAHTLAWLLPHVILLLIVGLVAGDVMRQRRVDHLLRETQEAILLEDWTRAWTVLNELLRSPIRRLTTRTQALLALAAVAEARHAFEAVQRVCEYLLERGLGHPVQQHVTRVTLGATMLRTGQTSDAVALIDRLSAQNLPGPMRAQVELLALFREVVLGHAHETLGQAAERRELFRAYLGTRAGYGYGLLAAAYDRANRSEEARQYWHDATLLVRPQDLTDRFAELAPIAKRYPAVENPF